MQNFWHSQWRRSLMEAICLSFLILGLFYYWFGIANRYVIFLYGHTATGISQAQPFDEMTASRYWVAGLVASAIVLVLYVPVCWLQGQIARWRQKPFVPSAWWQTWLLTAIPTGLGISIITMTMNQPTLPPALATACIAATLFGLAITSLAGNWAIRCPWELLWLIADGVGLMPVLLLLRVIELPGRGLSVSSTTVWLFSLGGLVAGVIWLTGLSLLRHWRHITSPNTIAIFLTGLGLSYILMPLVHYQLATPPDYRYISTASNFFAFNLSLQVLTLLVAFGLAAGATAFRRRLAPQA